MVNVPSPRRLYKYRVFSPQSLGLLLEDKVFFADPSTFNDPLDTRPSLETDLSLDELEDVLRSLVESRISAEMSVAAKAIKYTGPKTRAHIGDRSRRVANRLVADISYQAANPEYDISFESAKQLMLSHQIEVELLKQYEKGVLSFAARHNCPLMWSHYGDQHRGMCLGYSVPDDAKLELRKVNYGGSRLVKASDVQAMLASDIGARRRVDDGILFRKAQSWRYEREWRLIGTRGLGDSPLELEEIIFGIRCPDAVRHAVARAMQGRVRPVKLFEMRERPGTFLLSRHVLDDDELAVTYPRRAREAAEAFEIIDSP